MPKGPYSQAVKANGLLFVSGQLPVDPGTGRLVQGTIEEQTRQCLINISSIIEAAGGSLFDILKITCFLKNIKDFPKFNQVYSSFFSGIDVYPARTTVEVSDIPLDALIELDAIAEVI